MGTKPYYPYFLLLRFLPWKETQEQKKGVIGLRPHFCIAGRKARLYAGLMPAFKYRQNNFLFELERGRKARDRRALDYRQAKNVPSRAPSICTMRVFEEQNGILVMVSRRCL
jgi:hypothetical protein